MTGVPKLKSGSIAKTDYVNFNAQARKKDEFKYASSVSGKTKQQLTKEIIECSRWPGKITRSEYFTYRLYEKNAAEQKEFISEWMHIPIHEFCQDSKWTPITEDKIETINTLTEEGIPTVQNYAVLDKSNNQYKNQTVLRSHDDLVDFLQQCPLPIFCKPVGLLASFGVFKITAVSEDAVQLGDKAESPISELFNLMGNVPYLLQPVIQNHYKIKEFATAAATIRTMNFISNNVKLVHCILKIPVRDNIADNAWRDGNLVAEINTDTGIIERIVEGTGAEQLQHSAHPILGNQLEGIQLPHWNAMLELNKQTADMFSAIKYLTLDLAITDNGPITVEVNSGGSFTLPQVASGKGFLNDENKDFFESCGVNFETLPSPTKLALRKIMQRFNPFSN